MLVTNQECLESHDELNEGDDLRGPDYIVHQYIAVTNIYLLLH